MRYLLNSAFSPNWDLVSRRPLWYASKVEWPYLAFYSIKYSINQVNAADWIKCIVDALPAATGEETFEHVSFTCTPWCSIIFKCIKYLREKKHYIRFTSMF